MNDNEKKLNYFSWVYVVLAGLTLLLVGVNFLFPNVAKNIISTKYSDIDFKGLQPTVILALMYFFESMVYLWYFWLIKRIVKGKSNGFFVMILLVFGIIGSFIDQFNSFNISTLIGIFVHAYVFQIIFMIRQENKKDKLL